MQSFTKFLGSAGTPIVPPVVEAEYTLPVAAFTSAGIYKASDPEPKTLLRTLWGNIYQQAGLHTIYWDGLDDLGNNIIATNDYEAVLLTHQIEATWQTIANTSSVNHGPTVMQSYSRFVKAAISGDNIYIGESFNEGGARAGFKLNRTNIQVSVDILPYAQDPNASNPNDTDLSTEYICTNGTVTFWGGNDAYAAYHSPPRTGASWVFGTYVSNDTNYPFFAGTSEKCGLGKTYPNAIDVVIDQPSNIITGMCCNNTFVWIARGSVNEINCYDTVTGALVRTITGFTNPRELTYDSSNGGRVWFLQGVNNVVKGVVNAGTGNITSGALNILDFPSDKQTFAIDNLTNTLAVAVGGTNQNVWFWNISASTPSSNHFAVLGQTGGYSSTAVAADDRFSFTDYTTGLTKGLDKPYLAYDNLSNLYVGDVGSTRMQVFDSSLVFTTSVMMQGTVYGISANMSDAYKAYAGPLEFNTTTKQLSRNFSAQIQPDYFTQGYDVFKWCTNISGLTFATLPNYSTYPPNVSTELVELSDSGIRYTGVFINESGQFFGNFLDKDFTIWNIYSASYAVGQTPIIRKKTVTGLDGSNNPTYSAWTTVCTLQAITADDCLIDAGNTTFVGVTNSGIVILKSKEITTTALWHLQGYDITTGNLVWSTYRPDTRAGDFAGFLGYVGQFPDPRYFERGNLVNTNTFNDTQTVEDLTILIYNGENWKAKQTNYFNVYYKNGLPITQFGTNRVASEAIEPTGVKSSGNGFSMRMVKKDNDTYYCFNGDESVHSALHFWTLPNISSITTQTIAITPPTSAPAVGTNLLASVTFNSLIANVGNITGDVDGGGFTIQSGNTRYDSYQVDAYMTMVASSFPGQSKSKNFAITYTPGMTNWKVFGQITWDGFYGPENTAYQPTASLEILDDVGKVIARIGMGQLADSTYRLVGNTATIENTQSTNIIVNKFGAYNDFSILVNASFCTISYSDYLPHVISPIVDPTAAWNKPSKARLIVKDLNTFHYGTRCIGVEPLRYAENV